MIHSGGSRVDIFMYLYGGSTVLPCIYNRIKIIFDSCSVDLSVILISMTYNVTQFTNGFTIR